MNVVFIQSFVKKFRVPFYERLIEQLGGRGINVRLVFGQPDRYHAGDSDIVSELPFGVRTVNSYFYAGSRSLVWQPALKHLRQADLVIVQQGNRHLLNYLLLASRKFLNLRLAFWGHGKNFQCNGNGGAMERLKAWYSRIADHWFAYTDRSKAVLRAMGVPEKRITTVYNAIDTRKLTQCYQSIGDGELRDLRRKLDLKGDEPVAIYCGHFTGYKTLNFMLDCARRVKVCCPRFRFLLMGEGDQIQSVRQFTQQNGRWAHYVGPQYGRRKAAFFKLACCQIMPGAVGLAVLDSLAMQTPLLTRELSSHGPEIDYLEHGVNGIMTSPSEQAYSTGVLDFLEDKSLQHKLIQGCSRTRDLYTIENMADRFARGVCAVLDRKR